MNINIGKFRLEAMRNPAGTRFAKWFDNITGVLLYGSTGLVWQGQDRRLLWQGYTKTGAVGGKMLLMIARPLIIFGYTNWTNWDTSVLQGCCEFERRKQNSEIGPDVSQAPAIPTPMDLELLNLRF